MKSKVLIKKRIYALLIDLIILSQISMLLNNFMKLNFELSSIRLFNKDIDYGFSLMFLVFITYFICFDIFKNGISIGKKVIGISIIHSENKIISKTSICNRTFLKLISLWLFPISIFIYLLFGIVLQDLFYPKIITKQTIKNRAYLNKN